MPEVPVENLVDGRRYRVQILDGSREPFIGKLMPLFPGSPDNYREFHNVILHPRNIRRLHWGNQSFTGGNQYVDTSTHRFFNSGESLTYNQAYRGISLPEGIPYGPTGVVKSFVEGPTTGPQEFPARPETGLNRTATTNNRNAEKPKKPRTRKNKRKSKKSKKN